MPTTTTKTTATKRAIDFTNVKERGDHNPKHKPAGDYRAKIVKVGDHVKSGEKQATGWVYTIALVSDQRATYPYYCMWGDKQEWKIRNLFVAAGLTVPKKKVMVDPNKVVGREIGITLEDDEYEGRMKSTVYTTFPTSELTGDEPEDEAGDEAEADEDEDLDEVDLEEV
jgi:hypothetical protein